MCWRQRQPGGSHDSSWPSRRTGLPAFLRVSNGGQSAFSARGLESSSLDVAYSLPRRSVSGRRTSVRWPLRLSTAMVEGQSFHWRRNTRADGNVDQPADGRLSRRSASDSPNDSWHGARALCRAGRFIFNQKHRSASAVAQ